MLFISNDLKIEFSKGPWDKEGMTESVCIECTNDIDTVQQDNFKAIQEAMLIFDIKMPTQLFLKSSSLYEQILQKDVKLTK